MSLTLSNLPRNLRTVRDAAGMRQGEVARKAGIDPAQLSKFEAGNKGGLSLKNFVAIANALSASADAFLKE